MGDNLSIGLALKNNALILKPGLELCIVFDDSVVNYGNRSAYICVGMRIEVARLTVGCPARVSDTDISLYDGTCFFDKLIQSLFCLVITHVLRSFYNLISDFLDEEFECSL